MANPTGIHISVWDSRDPDNKIVIRTCVPVIPQAGDIIEMRIQDDDVLWWAAWVVEKTRWVLAQTDTDPDPKLAGVFQQLVCIDLIAHPLTEADDISPIKLDGIYG